MEDKEDRISEQKNSPEFRGNSTRCGDYLCESVSTDESDISTPNLLLLALNNGLPAKSARWGT